MCTVLLPPADNPIAVNKYISYIMTADTLFRSGKCFWEITVIKKSIKFSTSANGTCVHTLCLSLSLCVHTLCLYVYRRYVSLSMCTHAMSLYMCTHAMSLSLCVHTLCLSLCVRTLCLSLCVHTLCLSLCLHTLCLSLSLSLYIYIYICNSHKFSNLRKRSRPGIRCKSEVRLKCQSFKNVWFSAINIPHFYMSTCSFLYVAAR
jgi:hypothetical protein